MESKRLVEEQRWQDFLQKQEQRKAVQSSFFDREGNLKKKTKEQEIMRGKIKAVDEQLQSRQLEEAQGLNELTKQLQVMEDEEEQMVL